MARRFLGAVALFSALSLVFAACGSSGSKTPASSSSPVTSNEPVPDGGTLVIGAEQEPDCFDWVGQCGGSQWGAWMAQLHGLAAELTEP